MYYSNYSIHVIRLDNQILMINDLSYAFVTKHFLLRILMVAN